MGTSLARLQSHLHFRLSCPVKCSNFINPQGTRFCLGTIATAAWSDRCRDRALWKTASNQVKFERNDMWKKENIRKMLVHP